MCAFAQDSFPFPACGFPCLHCAYLSVRKRKHGVRLPADAAAAYVDVKRCEHDVRSYVNAHVKPYVEAFAKAYLKTFVNTYVKTT